MSTATIDLKANTSASKLVINGAIAGLAGGAVFGMMMGLMGMLPMVGMLVGQESAIIGLGVHMLISALIGAVYGVVAGKFALNATKAVVSGMINGVVWWVLGALILMPAMLGLTKMIFVIEQTQWLSLMGHIIYGVVTALVFIPLVKRS